MADEWLESAAQNHRVEEMDVPAPVNGESWLTDAATKMRQQHKATLSTSLTAAAGGNPDQAAKLRQGAKKAGIPADVAKRNPTAVPKMQAAQAAQELFRQEGTPATKAVFQDTAFAEVAHDRVEQLSFLERNINALEKGALNLGVTMEAVGFGVNNMLEWLGEGLLPKPQGMSDAEWEWSKAKGKEASRTGGLRLAARHASEVPTDPYILEISKVIDEQQSTLGGVWEGTKYLATHPSIFPVLLAEQIPSLAAFGPAGSRLGHAASTFAKPAIERIVTSQAVRKVIETGVPLATTQFTTNTGMVFGAELTEGISKGMEIPDAISRAGTKAVVEGGINALSGFLPVPKGTSKLQRLGSTVAEAEKQGIFGAAGAAGAAAAVDEEITLSELFLEHFGEFATGPIDLAMVAMTDPNAKKAQQQEAVRILNEAAKVEEAMGVASQMEALGTLAAEEELRTRDPEAFNAFVEEVTKDGATEIFIEADKFRDTLEQSGLNPQEVMDELPSVAAQYADAIATGGDLRIPMGEYVTKIAATEYHQALAQHARLRAEGMSPAEAAAWKETAVAEFEQRARASVTDEALDEKVRKPAEQVYDRVKAHLETLEQPDAPKGGIFGRKGKLSKKTVDSYARLHQAVATVLASRGIDPARYYDQFFVGGVAPAADGAQFEALRQEPIDTTIGSIAVEEFEDAQEQAEFIEQYRARTIGRPPRESEVAGTTISGQPARDGWHGATRVSRGGKPATVYRGSGRGVSPDSFATLGANTEIPAGGLGVYFSSSATEAQKYGTIVSEVFLDIRNPKVYTLPTFKAEVTDELHLTDLDTAKSFAERLRGEGHDGIAVDMRDVEGGGVHFIAFDPEQVIHADSVREEAPAELFQEQQELFGDQIDEEGSYIEETRDVQPRAEVRDQAAFVGRETVREVDTGFDAVDTAAKVAYATSTLTKSAQEKLWAIVTDKGGRPLEVLNHSMGLRAEAAVDHGIVAGWAAGVPGGAHVWLSHNHPSGDPKLSSADTQLSERVRNLLDGSGLNYRGIMAVVPGRFEHELAIEDADMAAPEGANPVGVVERTLERDPLAPSIRVTSPDNAKKIIESMSKGEDGIVLLDNKHSPVGFLPLDIEDAGALRGGQLPGILRALEATNASAAIINTSKSVAGGQDVNDIQNIGNMMEAANIRVLDAFAGGISLAQISQPITTGAEFRQGERAPRGKLSFKADDLTGAPTVISLLEGADLSTFIHESGHFFFEIWRDAAMRFGEDPAFMEDMNALLEFVDVDTLAEWDSMTIDQRRAGHEKVARAFEAYLFTGKAPTPALRSLFETFATWLRKVYLSLKNLNVELTPEVRQVFDRMVATEEQIDIAERNQEFKPLFTSAEEAGMTEEEFAEYEELRATGHEDAIHELESRSLRDMKWISNAKNRTLAKLQRQQDDTRRRIRKEVEKEVRTEPVYNAMNFFKKGEGIGADGEVIKVEEGNKLDIDALEGMYPTDIPRSKAGEVDPAVDELRTAIAKLGGINQAEAESEGVDPAHWSGKASRGENQPIFGKRIFVKTGGQSMDGMAELLSQYGYFTTDDITNELMDRLDSSLADEPQYSTGVSDEILRFGELGMEEFPEWRTLGYGAYGILGKDGMHPDMAADLFGFSSGDEMVRALLEARPEDAVITGLTDQRMIEDHGDLVDAATIEEAANKAVHNEARQRMVATELKAISKLANIRAIDRKQAKEYAEAAIAKLRVRDVSPHQFEVAERRAAKASNTAQAKGETLTAARAKQEEFINGALVREARSTRDEMDKAIDYLKKFDRKGSRKTIDPEYLDQIDQILARFDLRKGASLKSIDKRVALRDWVAGQGEMGLVPVIDERLLNEALRESYKNLPVSDMRELRDSIKNIEHLGRLKQKLLTARDERAFAEIVDSIESSIRDNATRTIERNIETRTPTDDNREFLGSWFAAHRKLASYAREMDGQEDAGVLWEYFIRPMNEKGDFEAVEREKATLRFSELFEPYLGIKEELKQTATRITRGKIDSMKPAMMQRTHFPAIGRSLSKMAQLVVALNWGNNDNRQRIMDGYGWDESQVQAILNSLDETDWNFVQGMWDFVDEYWGQISDKEKRVTGIAPKKVEAAPVLTPFGEFRGGYYPIKYDERQSARTTANIAKDAAERALKGAFTRSTTRRGHTKERAAGGGGQKVRLDFGVAFEHVDQVVHDLAWHEWLIDANRLLGTKRIQEALYDHYGAPVYRVMKKAVEDIASGDVPAEMAFERSINWLRTGTSIAGMGWSLWTSLLQPLGLTQGMARIGPKWVARGMSQWLGDAARMQSTVEGVHERSPFMRLRDKTMQREINEIQNKVMAGGVLTRVQDSFFYLIVKAQMVADMPIWLGQYEKSISEGQDEKTAIALADQAVLDTQGGGQVKDLAQIQRGGPLLKLWTNFYSFFNTTYNLTAESYSRTKFSKPKEVGRFAVDMMLIYTIPAVISGLMREALKGGCGGDEQCIMEELAREQASYMAGTMIGLREFSSFLNGFYGYAGPAGTRFFSESSKLAMQAQQGELDAAALKALNNTAGILFHYPAGQVQRTASGVAALADGDTDSPLAPLFGPKRD